MANSTLGTKIQCGDTCVDGGFVVHEDCKCSDTDVTPIWCERDHDFVPKTMTINTRSCVGIGYF